ncbi:MAG: Fic family protein [Candidatus ainarchaeum sp.]|nr:Fic family protein [Candidatus ainarchaeum sp.]
MGLRSKKVSGKDYYYLDLSYRLLHKAKTYSKYVGSNKPTAQKLKLIESNFKDEIIKKLTKTDYECNLISKDDFIRAILFRDLFYKKYKALTPTKRKKYDIDNTIIFTLTTLTTEDVQVNLEDVINAYEKNKDLNIKEQISKNMLNAIEKLKENKTITLDYILGLHGLIMSNFESKTPGLIRNKQVKIHKTDKNHPLGAEIAYNPPHYSTILPKLKEFVDWLNNSKLNPIEKSALAHYKMYLIHPFLDGNKRTCRLIFNKILLNNCFPLINISQDKDKYFDRLLESTEKQDPKYFVNFVREQYLLQTKKFLNR